MNDKKMSPDLESARSIGLHHGAYVLDQLTDTGAHFASSHPKHHALRYPLARRWDPIGVRGIFLGPNMSALFGLSSYHSERMLYCCRMYNMERRALYVGYEFCPGFHVNVREKLFCTGTGIVGLNGAGESSSVPNSFSPHQELFETINPN